MTTNPSKPELGTVDAHLQELVRVAELTRALAPTLEGVALRVVDVLSRGSTLLFCGNGGSAADAQHLAAEYVVRFRRARRGLPALALTVDSSVLTAGGNDFGFDDVFARQVEALGRPGDLLFLHSTSGNSPNLLRAAEVAQERGIHTVALLARDGGRLHGLVDDAIVIPTDVTAHAQELHLALGHAVCEIVDREFAAREEESR